MVLGQLDFHTQRNEVRALPHAIYKTELKMDHRPKHKQLNCTTCGGGHRVKPCDLGLCDFFFLDMTPKAQATKEKIDKVDFIKIKNFSASKDPNKKVKRNTP